MLYEISQGKTVEEAARKLGIDFYPAKHLLRNIYTKLGTADAASATAVAISTGLIRVKRHKGPPEPALDKEQKAVLVCIGKGMSNQRIGKETGLTIYQVSWRIKALRKILQAKYRPHLVYRGFETGNLVINRRKPE
jgi:DNA-binding NarL/FixJ family response regulator